MLVDVGVWWCLVSSSGWVSKNEEGEEEDRDGDGVLPCLLLFNASTSIEVSSMRKGSD